MAGVGLNLRLNANRLSCVTVDERRERWQSGRMRIIANDVIPEMGSGGSNPPLSAQNFKSNSARCDRSMPRQLVRFRAFFCAERGLLIHLSAQGHLLTIR